MRLLDNIESKFLLSTDVETVSIVENFDDLSEDYQAAWVYKMKNEGKDLTHYNLNKTWKEEASFHAEFSKVCAISVTYLDKTGEGLMCKEFYSEEGDELEILLAFAIFVNKIKKRDSRFRLVAHGGKFFDYPYLCKRMIINDMRIPLILDDAHLKPWEQLNICTNMDIWKMGGTGPGTSLIALCVAMGLPNSKQDMTGEDVGRLYYLKEFKRISRYCSKDSISVFNFIRKIKGERIFQFDEVKYV